MYAFKTDDLLQVVINEIQQTNHRLSVRAQNVIGSIIEYDPIILLYYVWGFEEVKNLRNVGKKTDTELQIYFEDIKNSVEKFCNEGLNKQLKIIKIKNRVFLEEDLNECLKFEEVIRNNVDVEINKTSLSNRAIHVLKNLLNLQFQAFLEYVFSIRDIREIKNAGVITFPELELFFAGIREFLVEKSFLKDDLVFYNLHLAFFEFPKIQSFIIENRNSFYENNFPVYSFFRLLITEGYFLKKKEIHILIRSLGLFGTKKARRSEIAAELSVKSERIRRVFKTLIKKLKRETNQFLQIHGRFIDFTFLKDVSRTAYFYRDEDFKSHINNQENVLFSSTDIEFLTALIIQEENFSIQFNVTGRKNI